MALALPVLALVACISLFQPWMRTGVGNLQVVFTPVKSDISRVGAWIVVVTLLVATPLGLRREWGLALVGWASSTLAFFAILHWLLIQRFSSLFSIRIVKTEFGSVIQPALVVSLVSSLIMVAIVVFDALGEVSASPMLKSTGGIRAVLALVGSIAILLARDLPFVYARIGSVTWAIGGGAIPALGELLGIAGLVCAGSLILSLFVSHVALDRAVVVSAATFGVCALVAIVIDSAIVALISSLLGRVSGRPDGEAVIEGAFGPWVCVAVAVLLVLGALYAGRLSGDKGGYSVDLWIAPHGGAPTI